MVALVLFSMVAAGCSSDGTADGAAPGALTAAPATGDVATTGPGPSVADGATLPTPGPASTVATAPGATATGSATSVASAAAELTGEALEQHLAQRYRAYWDAFDAARKAPTDNPAADFPTLSQLAAGTQLEVTYQSITDLAQTGEVIDEPARPAVDGVTADAEVRVRIDRIDGTVAELSGCVVNDDVRREVASGTVVKDSVSTVLSQSTMALTEGQWKLIRSQAVEIADGVAGCWLAADAFPR